MSDTARNDARDLLGQVAEALETAYDTIDQQRARIAELKPSKLTPEQAANIDQLADKIARASNIAAAASTQGDYDVGDALDKFLTVFAGNILSGARFSPILLRRADKLAAALLGEGGDRG